MIIQKKNQYIPHVPQTSFKSTMLPVVFTQTTQTNQSHTLAQPSSKVKIENAPIAHFPQLLKNRESW